MNETKEVIGTVVDIGTQHAENRGNGVGRTVWNVTIKGISLTAICAVIVYMLSAQKAWTIMSEQQKVMRASMVAMNNNIKSVNTKIDSTFKNIDDKMTSTHTSTTEIINEIRIAVARLETQFELSIRRK